MIVLIVLIVAPANTGEQRFSRFLGDRKFVAGDYVTYADFILYDALDFHRLIVPGSLDAHPALIEYLNRIESLPKLNQYFKSPRFDRHAIWGPMSIHGGVWGKK